MDAEQIRARARYLGVTLHVPKDRDVIIARPKSSVTPELAQAIRENKDTLMRDVLLHEALHYLNERFVKGADLSVLHAPGERLSAVHADGTLDEFRKAVREYVEAGLKEFERARRIQRKAVAS
jgi:hypothetical protein